MIRTNEKYVCYKNPSINQRKSKKQVPCSTNEYTSTSQGYLFNEVKAICINAIVYIVVVTRFVQVYRVGEQTSRLIT